MKNKAPPQTTALAVPVDLPPREIAARYGSLTGMLANYSALPATEADIPVTTLDMSKRENLLKLQHALAGQSESLWDLPPDRIIRVSDLIATYREFESQETGEIQKGPMLTVCGPDGAYHTGSQFAFRALQLIAGTHGLPPWNPPIKVVAIRVKSRNKREFQSILLAE